MIDRRLFLKGLIGIIASPYISASNQVSLKTLASDNGIRFGSAVGLEVFRNSRYRKFILEQCSVITPEDHFKWKKLVTSKNFYDFNNADRLYDFANDNNLAFRGHSLIFEKSMRQWISANKTNIKGDLERFIRTIVSRYYKIESWDLFNEIIDPNGIDGWLRDDAIYRTFGRNYLKTFSELVQNLSQNSELVVNEWIGPYENSYFIKRQTAVLRMLEYIREQNIAVGTLGIQSHLLFTSEDYEAKTWRNFCANCKDLGFQIKLSEMDLSLGKNKTSFKKEAEVFSSVKDFLDDTLSFANVNELITWGIVDSYSFTMKNDKWSQLKYGGTPFKEDYSEGILGRAIRLSLKSAPPYEQRA